MTILDVVDDTERCQISEKLIEQVRKWRNDEWCLWNVMSPAVCQTLLLTQICSYVRNDCMEGSWYASFMKHGDPKKCSWTGFDYGQISIENETHSLITTHHIIKSGILVWRHPNGVVCCIFLVDCWEWGWVYYVLVFWDTPFGSVPVSVGLVYQCPMWAIRCKRSTQT